MCDADPLEDLLPCTHRYDACSNLVCGTVPVAGTETGTQGYETSVWEAH